MEVNEDKLLNTNELESYFNQQENNVKNELKLKINSNCTNSKNLDFNIKNTQEIFYCLDCSKDKKPNVVCLACTVYCHNDHNLIEIGGRRNMKCDCLIISKCEFENDIKDFDHKNSYNKNFNNIFCDCKTEFNENLFMIQCFFCEDYKHLNCMGINIEIREYLNEFDIPDNLLSMICIDCFKDKFKFLSKYDNLLITDLNKLKFLIDLNNTKDSNEEVIKSDQCIINSNYIIDNKKIQNIGYLLDDNWFKLICYCNKCIEYYKEIEIYDLLNLFKEETSEEYKSKFFKADTNNTNLNKYYDKLKLNCDDALNKMEISKKYKLFSNINSFVDDFIGYIHNISDNTENKVIDKEDINNFFNKKP